MMRYGACTDGWVLMCEWWWMVGGGSEEVVVRFVLVTFDGLGGTM